MARLLRAQKWPELAFVEEEPPVSPVEREPWGEPWRALQSSLSVRFIGQRGGEIDVDRVDPQARAELVAALDARHRLGSTYATFKSRNFAGISKGELATLDLLVFGFIEVRHLKTGEFRLDFRSFNRKARFTVQELYATAFKLRRLV